MRKRSNISLMFKRVLGTKLIIELGITITAIVDALCISRFLGESAMAAYGLISPIITIASMFAGFIGIGVQIICARKLAEVKTDEANGVFMLSVCLCLLISTLLTIICAVAPNSIINILGGNKPNLTDEVRALSKEYLKGYLFSFIPLIFVVAIIPLIELDDGAKLVKMSIIANLSIKIILDILNGLVFKMGMFGMALATSISVIVEFSIIFTHFFKKDIFFNLRPKNVRFKEFRNIFQLGMPVTVRSLASIIKSILLNRIVLTVASTSGLMALAVQGKIKDLGDAFSAAIGSGMLLLTGMIYAEENKNDLSKLFKLGLKNQIIPLIVGSLFVLASPLLCWAFTGSLTGQSLVIIAIICYGISLVFSSLNNLYTSYLHCMGKKFIASFFIISIRLTLVLTAFVFTKLFGVIGLFIAYPISEIIVLMVMTIYVMIFNKRFITNINDFLVLPKDFGNSPDKEKNYEIRNREEACNVCDIVRQFAVSAGLNEKEAYYSSLAIEEFSVNIIDRAFNFNNLSIDIRLIIKEDKTIIRIRDNYLKFSPKEYLKIHQDTIDNDSCLGLKMAFINSEYVNHIYTFKLNNLLIVQKRL